MRIASLRYIISALIAVVCILTTPPTLAERTMKQVIVLDEPGGDASFILAKDAFIDCLENKGSYVEVGFNISFPEEYLVEEGVLKGGIPLFDESTGARIGKTVAETEVFMTYKEKGHWVGSLIGYIPRSDVDPKSVPEVALAAILNGRKQPLKLADLKAHIARMRYSAWIAGKGHRSYYMTDNSVMDGAGFRLGLVFRQDTLVAVIHSRPLAVRFTGTEIVRDEQYNSGLNMSYVVQLSEKEKSVIREVFFTNLIYAN